MSSNEQSNSSWTFHRQNHETDFKPARCDSRKNSSTLSKSLDVSGQEVAGNVLVPVIFASDNKTKRTSTTEIPLQDLLNGNIVNPEGNNDIPLNIHM